jgi:hypothetical protein
MKTKRTILIITALAVIAFVFAYTTEFLNTCPDTQAKVKTEQTQNSEINEQNTNKNESLFIGCNGFF